MNDSPGTSPKLLDYNVPEPFRAFSTMRQGGVSQGKYGAFNVNAYCGDLPEHVNANRRLLCTALGLDSSRLVMPHQTHQDRCLAIDRSFFEQTAEARARSLEGVDAIMTDLKETCIGVSTADCVPILLVDPDHQAVGAVHAGWRGTVLHIAGKAVRTMQKVYQTDPGNVLAIIGPSISMANFEVGDEVVEAFATAGFPVTEVARQVVNEAGIPRWHIDLWAANTLTLLEAGLALHHITVSGICSYANVSSFFSARRLGIASGRIFCGVLIRP